LKALRAAAPFNTGLRPFFYSRSDALSATIPDKEPASFVSGDTVKWYRTFADYPVADGWVLTYAFNGLSKLELSAEVTAAADNSRWEIVIPIATTALLLPGTYTWAAYVALAGERYRAARGVTQVHADVSALSAIQNRAELELRIIDAAIAGRLTADTESYQINGRAVSLTPIAQLLKIRGYLREEVRRQRGGNAFETVGVTFARVD
jgi:hypothetical protein